MPTAQKKASTVEAADKKPRLSKLERLKRDLAEAEAAEQAKLSTKINIAKETLRIAVNGKAKADAKLAKAVDELLGLGVTTDEINAFAATIAPAAVDQAEAEPEA